MGRRGDWDHDRRQFTRSEIIGIIRPRVEEILEEVAHKLQAARFDTLPGQRDRFDRWVPAKFQEWKDWPAVFWANRYVWAAHCACMVYHRPRQGQIMRRRLGWHYMRRTPQDECWDFNVPAQRIGAKPMKRAMQWVKENW